MELKKFTSKPSTVCTKQIHNVKGTLEKHGNNNKSSSLKRHIKQHIRETSYHHF
jgi:hypothetical protein